MEDAPPYCNLPNCRVSWLRAEDWIGFGGDGKKDKAVLKDTTIDYRRMRIRVFHLDGVV